jgi:hypothetical protein
MIKILSYSNPRHSFGKSGVSKFAIRDNPQFAGASQLCCGTSKENRRESLSQIFTGILKIWQSVKYRVTIITQWNRSQQLIRILAYLEMVKKALAILLTCIYLFGATDASQLLKLPLLISHYITHKKENPTTTVASFFKMHYVDPQPYDADYSQDMQLPFKTAPNAFFRYTPSVLSQVLIVRPRILWIDKEITPASNEDVFSSLLTNKVFQPPRV